MYIWALHDGNKNESKATEVFKLKACTIDNLIPDIPFKEYALDGSSPTLKFNKFKFADSDCQTAHGDKLKYAISNTTNTRTKVDYFDEFASCKSNVTECTAPVTTIGKIPSEENLFIWAYFDGIIEQNHGKPSKSFMVYRCDISMVKSSIDFEQTFIAPDDPTITFTKWKFPAKRCQDLHGENLKYAISSKNDTRLKITHIDEFAKCTNQTCIFKVD